MIKIRCRKTLRSVLQPKHVITCNNITKSKLSKLFLRILNISQISFKKMYFVKCARWTN